MQEHIEQIIEKVLKIDGVKTCSTDSEGFTALGYGRRLYPLIKYKCVICIIYTNFFILSIGSRYACGNRTPSIVRSLLKIKDKGEELDINTKCKKFASVLHYAGRVWVGVALLH